MKDLLGLMSKAKEMQAKFQALQAAGVHIVRSPADMGKKMAEVLGR